MKTIKLGTKTISTELPAFVMGIVNATPDSFYDSSRGGVERAVQLIEEGADFLDIGAESTRPDAEEITAEEEIKRILPVVKEIRKISDIPLSIDTRRSEVLNALIPYGIDVLNDVSALEDDEKIIKIASQNDLSVILMHRLPHSAQNSKKNDIVSLVSDYLTARASYALTNGIPSSKIIIDPGIGFGKTFEENIALIKNADNLKKAGYPLLMALSRKRCIGEITGREVQDRLAGTITADIFSVLKGADIIRVHDVKESIDSLKVMKYLA